METIALVKQFFFPAAILLSIVVIFAALKRSKQNLEKAKLAARMLGLELQDPIALLKRYADSGDPAVLAVVDSEVIESITSTIEGATLKKMIESPIGKKMLKLSLPWVITGRHHGHQVNICHTRHGGKNKKTYTRYGVRFTQPLPFSFTLKREDVFTRFGRKLGVLQDITVGDPELDRLLEIKGDRAAELRDWLAGAGRKQELIELFQKPELISLSQTGVVLEERENRVQTEVYRRALDRLTLVIGRLEGRR